METRCARDAETRFDSDIFNSLSVFRQKKTLRLCEEQTVQVVTLTAKNNGKKIACHAIKAVRIRNNARVMEIIRRV